jgi:hypothetical protein
VVRKEVVETAQGPIGREPGVEARDRTGARRGGRVQQRRNDAHRALPDEEGDRLAPGAALSRPGSDGGQTAAEDPVEVEENVREA